MLKAKTTISRTTVDNGATLRRQKVPLEKLQHHKSLNEQKQNVTENVEQRKKKKKKKIQSNVFKTIVQPLTIKFALQRMEPASLLT